jgi:hypothetical protein
MLRKRQPWKALAKATVNTANDIQHGRGGVYNLGKNVMKLHAQALVGKQSNRLIQYIGKH